MNLTKIMFGFDDIESKLQTLQFVVITNNNQKKQYQTIIKNISFDQHLSGQIKMEVFDSDEKLMLSQGPKDYHIHPIGTPSDHRGSDTTFQEWEFDITEKFKPGLQYFVVFNAKDVNSLGSRVQKFTSFFIEEKEEAAPVIEDFN